MQWAEWKLNVTGELYWDSIFLYPNRLQDGVGLPTDPWTDQSNAKTGANAGSGDGNLFAFGSPGQIGGESEIPVETQRLKLIRDGIEDYEYMMMLEKKLGREAVEREIEPVIQSAWNYTNDAGVLLAVRRRIGRLLTAA